MSTRSREDRESGGRIRSAFAPLASGVGSREIPGYLARYRERGFGDGASPNGSLYLRRFRESTNGSGEEGRGSRHGGIEVHLIRHGQTQGYTVDGGLTPLGALQARRRGWDISKETQNGENIVLVAAETKRALRTAEFVLGGFEDGMASMEKSASVAGPEFVDEFQNFLVRTPSGFKDPTVASREYEKEVGRERSGVPMWLDEVGRFWGMQKGGADPIEYWLTFPLATFEPPGAVVRRYWAGIRKLLEENEKADRLICAVHSGPMRAFATTAIGRDLGEPRNTEEVRVKIKRDLSTAEVSYRGHTRKVEAPPLKEHTTRSWPTLKKTTPEIEATHPASRPSEEKLTR